MRSTRVWARRFACLLSVANCAPGKSERDGAEGTRHAAEGPAPPGRRARRPATIQFHDRLPEVEVPATGRVGQALPVTVTTYGGGCVTGDTTDVQVTGLQAEVTPAQRVYTPRGEVGGVVDGCTLELIVAQVHTAVTFRAPGRATVRVIGRAAPGDSLVRVERTVAIE